MTHTELKEKIGDVHAKLNEMNAGIVANVREELATFKEEMSSETSK